MYEDETNETEPAVALLTLVVPDSADEVVEASEPTFLVAGLARPGAVVSVDGDLVDLADDGAFAAEVALTDGLNLVEVIAIDPDTEEVVSVTFLVVLG